MSMSNPFADLTAFLPPLVMQVYVVAMALAVVLGTLYDMVHKRSAEYFARRRKQSQAAATRRLSSANTASIAIRTVLNEVATSGEFCNPRRRLSHLLMFYGFLLYLSTTVVMIFAYPTPTEPAPVALPLLWNTGAIMILIGGYWFFFLIRVDVAHEGHSPFRLVQADLFIVSLLASVTLALLWELVQMAGNPMGAKVAFGLYILFTTLLFVSVPWSKFAHMFYKPAAAFQRRVEEATGSSDLPIPTESPRGGR